MDVAVPRDGERGFTLIEALVAGGILTVVLACVLGAVTTAVHASNSAVPRAALAETAQNVLADLRASTAYDPDELAALAAAGTRRLSVPDPQADGSSAQHGITAVVAPNAAGTGYIATVTVDDAAGNTVTMHSTLVQEAPAPGSVIPLSTPPPAQSGSPVVAPPSGCEYGLAPCRNPCLLGRGCKTPL